MKQFTVTDNDAGQRLDKFITKAVPLLPKSLLYKSIRLKRIKVNKNAVRFPPAFKRGMWWIST